MSAADPHVPPDSDSRLLTAAEELACLLTEQWRPAVGWPNYQVSSFGRVRRIARTQIYRNGDRHTYATKLMTIQTESDGRRSLILSHAGRKRPARIHNLVAAAFIGPRPAGLQVCHWDGDASNNWLANLRYDTPSANSKDQLRHGVHNNGNRALCRRRGHLLVEPNLMPASLKLGKRECLACSRAQHFARYHGLQDVEGIAERIYAELDMPEEVAIPKMHAKVPMPPTIIPTDVREAAEKVSAMLARRREAA